MNPDTKFAFPKAQSDYSENRGMTLRDYFAAKAMQGMLSDPTVACDGVRLACIAYAHADAMLAERDK